MVESLSLSWFEECKPVNANAFVVDLQSYFVMLALLLSWTCYGCLSRAGSVFEFLNMQGFALEKLQRENSRLHIELSRIEHEVQRQKGLRWAINFNFGTLQGNGLNHVLNDTTLHLLTSDRSTGMKNYVMLLLCLRRLPLGISHQSEAASLF